MGILEAIGYIGDTVDKFTGARALRGALAGKPRELLTPLPFSDALGITRESDLTTGRELTDKFGLTSKHDKGWASSAAGFGADMLLDPSNLLGGIGLHKLGKVALHGDDAARAAGRARGLVGTLHESLGVSPSLGLKYDDIADAASAGLRRSDPEWVNNRTFYHGTATPNLTAEALDPMKTAGDNLFGHGIYTTDDYGQPRANDITKGYAKAALGRPMSLWEGARDNYASRQSRRISRRIGRETGWPPELELIDAIRSRLRGKYDARNPQPKGIVYQGQSDFGNILDLNGPASKGVREISAALGDRATMNSEATRLYLASKDPTASADSIVRAGKSVDPEFLIRALRGEGYDALTHTGGQIMGRPPHQVVIGIDPKYQQWEKFLELSKDDLADYSLTPKHPASPTEHMAVKPWGGEQDPDIIRDAIAYGPKYGTSADDLRRALAEFAGPAQRGSALSLPSEGDELLAMIGNEIPPGSSPLSSGAEGAVFEHGPGHVIRVGSRKSDHLQKQMGSSGTEYGRANTREMVQPVRSVDVGGYQVEHLPRITDMRKLDGLSSLAGMVVDRSSSEFVRAQNLIAKIRESTQGASAALIDSIKNSGLRPVDIAPGHNVGLGSSGEVLAFDPGTIVSRKPNASRIAPPDPVGLITPERGGVLERLQAPDEVRRAIMSGLSMGSAGRGLPMPIGPEYIDAVQRLRSILADATLNSGVDWKRIAAEKMPESPLRMSDIIESLTGATDVIGAAPQRQAPGLEAMLRGLLGDMSIAEDVPQVNAASGGGDGSLASRLRQFSGGTGAAMKLSPQDFERAAKRVGLGDPSLAAGLYSRGNDKIIMRQGQPSRVLREERGHSMVANAVKGGAASVASLPMAWQPGAWAQYLGGQGGVGRLGRYLDEVAQHGTRERGLGSKLLGSLRYATHPEIIPKYIDHLAKDNPVLAAIMNAPVAGWENRVPIGVAGIGAKNIAQLVAELRQKNA